MRRRRLFLGAVLAVALPASAAEPPTIDWVHPFTREGAFDPTRRADILEDNVLFFLMDGLTQYRSTIRTATVSRLMEILKSTDSACYPTLKKTPEREAFIAFSDPLFWSLPERLIGLESSAGRMASHIQANATVSLPDLVADHALAGAYEEGRAFSPSVNAVLAAARGSARLVDVSKEVNVYAMLIGGHIDWLVGYPTDAHRLLGLASPPVPYRSYAIAGSDTPFQVFAGCSGGSGGKAIIAAIDKLVESRPGGRALQDFYDRWIDPAEQAELARFIAEQRVQ
jgi:uncharacterized protein (TIGR02285 family)